ncbi:hypothetical protein HDK64DRAFT_303373 [Phyllosticta capitalensis]
MTFGGLPAASGATGLTCKFRGICVTPDRRRRLGRAEAIDKAERTKGRKVGDEIGGADSPPGISAGFSSNQKSLCSFSRKQGDPSSTSIKSATVNPSSRYLPKFQAKSPSPNQQKVAQMAASTVFCSFWCRHDSFQGTSIHQRLRIFHSSNQPLKRGHKQRQGNVRNFCTERTQNFVPENSAPFIPTVDTLGGKESHAVAAQAPLLPRLHSDFTVTRFQARNGHGISILEYKTPHSCSTSLSLAQCGYWSRLRAKNRHFAHWFLDACENTIFDLVCARSKKAAVSVPPDMRHDAFPLNATL